MGKRGMTRATDNTGGTREWANRVMASQYYHQCREATKGERSANDVKTSKVWTKAH